MPQLTFRVPRRRSAPAGRSSRPILERLDDLCLLSVAPGPLGQTDFQALALDYNVTVP